jgi:hypothetical protein
LHDALAKALQVTISTSVLLAALALAWRRSVGATPRIRQNLAAGALASLGLYCVAHIPSPSTEYKFVFAAAVMLAPFAGVAAEPWLQRAGRAWPLVVGACLIFGSLPYVHRQSSSLDWNAGEPWPVDVSHFPLRFEPSVRGASVLDAIREASPRDAVIAADAPLYDVTALTWRPLYAPENHHWIVPGVYIDAEYVLTKVRGYSRELVGQRRATCAALFHGDDAARESALATIARLARPIVVLGDERDPDHAALIAWLAGAGRGRELARDDGLVAWLVDARP